MVAGGREAEAGELVQEVRRVALLDEPHQDLVRQVDLGVLGTEEYVAARHVVERDQAHAPHVAMAPEFLEPRRHGGPAAQSERRTQHRRLDAQVVVGQEQADPIRPRQPVARLEPDRHRLVERVASVLLDEHALFEQLVHEPPEPAGREDRGQALPPGAVVRGEGCLELELPVRRVVRVEDDLPEPSGFQLLPARERADGVVGLVVGEVAQVEQAIAALQLGRELEVAGAALELRRLVAEVKLVDVDELLGHQAHPVSREDRRGLRDQPALLVEHPDGGVSLPVEGAGGLVPEETSCVLVGRLIVRWIHFVATCLV